MKQIKRYLKGKIELTDLNAKQLNMIMELMLIGITHHTAHMQFGSIN